jgi:aromatic-amino-acid transaminase
MIRSSFIWTPACTPWPLKSGVDFSYTAPSIPMKHLMTAVALATSFALPAWAQNIAIVNGKPVPVSQMNAFVQQLEKSMSLFSAVEMAPRDPILGLNEQFAADTNPNKVNLGVGVYYDDNGKLPLLQCVQTGRKSDDGQAHRPRLPAHRRHCRLRQRRQGPGVWCRQRAGQKRPRGHRAGHWRHRRPENRRRLPEKAQPQRQGADLRPQLGKPPRAVHNAGFAVDTYAYYDAAKRGVNFDGMLASLQAAEAGTIVVLHACCHNPTGYDITPAQWDQVIAVVKARGLTAFLDMAYQGFGHGIAEDGAVIAKFVALA